MGVGGYGNDMVGRVSGKSRLRNLSGLILVLMLAFSATLFAQDKQDQPTVILATQSFWRAFYTLKTPVIRVGDALEKMNGEYDTPLPPTAWQNPDFDDSTWHRSPGGFFQAYKSRYVKIVTEELGSTAFNGNSPALALICLRGKFKVSDPAKVKDLTLEATFRGGIIVYLNGKEVTRSHITGDNKKDMLAVADDYPMEAYLDAEGAPLHGVYWKKKEKTEQVMPRFRKRNRSIEKVSIPSSLLRPGINVLAIEVHRSAYSSDYIEKLLKMIKAKKRGVDIWSTCDLIKVQFSALEAQGLEPNASRPNGFQVWNSDLLQPDGILDFGGPREALKPIRIVGTRNGAFSGKVVVGCRDPIKGLKCTVSDLKQSTGAGKILASSIAIRYAMPAPARGGKWMYPITASHFDPLLEAAPDEISAPKLKGWEPHIHKHRLEAARGVVVPIWLTVKVPADAEPGNYKGDLTVRAEGLEDVKVPVDLKVSPFKLPDSQDFHTFTELIPSPETVAMYYKVPFWSDKHFKLMENTFKWLGEVGNRTVYIPLIAQTNFGNEETMVRWIKKEDGSYTHDFTVMNKYLDLVEERMGKPRIVILYVWDVFLEAEGVFCDWGLYRGSGRAEREELRGHGPQVSLLDNETGKVSHEELPWYTNKEASLKIWQPLIAELRENLKKRGLENRVMLGMTTDINPTKEVVSFFKELLPEAPWVKHAHSTGRNLHGQSYGCQAVVWSSQFIKWPDIKSQMGWNKKDLIVQYRRAKEALPALSQRLLCEINITGKQRGFGRLGADFWPVLKGRKGKELISIVNPARYLKSNWSSLNIYTTALLAPGPEGALGTARLEMIREGLQECEARILIERALAESKISGVLAERCQEMLNQRTHAMLLALRSRHYTAGLNVRGFGIVWGFRLGECWFPASNWQKRLQDIFEIAAEVAKEVGVEN